MREEPRGAGARRLVRGARYVLRLAFRAAPGRAAAVLVLTPLVALFAPATGLWMKLLVEDATRGTSSRLVWHAVGLAVSAAAGSVLGMVLSTLRTGLEDRVGMLVEEDLLRLNTSIPGLEHHESPAYQDRLRKVEERRFWVRRAVNVFGQALGWLLRTVGIAGLLAIVHPALLVLPIFAIPPLVGGMKAGRDDEKMLERTGERNRLRWDLFSRMTTAGPGAEIRVFGVDEEIARRHGSLEDELFRARVATERYGAVWLCSGWTIFSLAYVGAMAFVVAQAIAGRATAGDVVLAASAGALITASVGSLFETMIVLDRATRTIEDVMWFEEYGRAARARWAGGRAPVPQRLDAGISVDGVSFTYPGTDRTVLRDVTLRFPPGATVALVGDNGAGKTTLVKLLCRFYEPSEGSITLEGVPLRDLALDELRARTSAGFQDFFRFEFLARESAGVGDLASIEDADRILEGLARAGAADVVTDLPRGLETQLGNTWPDGVDLSVGQWQKVALGRAMMRDAPILRILDEPTASLDAQTEYALFERYARAVRDAGDARTITIIVSHRFSTVRMADLIVVIDGGRVVEQGTHEELMRAGGLYAELFTLQARQYR